jgi:hypothetical protein
MTRDDIGRTRQLPIQVPLQPGESPLSYVRRLATANHLRTSYLREYLVRGQRWEPGFRSPHTAAIDITRLSLVTGRTIKALQHVFPDLKPVTESPTSTDPPGWNMDLPDKIRTAAARDRVVNTLSVHFGVQRSTIIDALLGNRPDKNEEPLRSNPKLSAVAHHIDSRLAATTEITITQIWNELKNHYGFAVGYSTVRSYVNRARAQHSNPRHAQHLLTRARLYQLIRNHARPHDLISTLMTQFSADRATVISAFTSKAPWPGKPWWAPTASSPRRTRILSRHETYIDEMMSADPGIKIYEIMCHLLDHHQVNVSYSIVREYVARRLQENRHAGQIE